MSKANAAAPDVTLFARVTAGSAFLLLVAGGLVTSTGSSLSVPDWPLSFGKVLPPMVGGVRFEHGHRMIAGAVALMTFGLTVLVSRTSDSRARRLAFLASGAILLQALLGGLTVLLRLPPAISIAHACLGQTVFCLLLAVSETVRAPQEAEVPEGLWRIGALAVAAVYLQLILGAVLRHTGQGLFWHAAWAAAVFLAVSLIPAKTLISQERLSPLIGPAWALVVLLPAQIILGYIAYRVKFSPDFETGLHWGSALATAHVATGAAILGTSLLWTLRARP